MGEKVLPERKRLAAVFASFAILIYGSVSLFQDMAINYYTVIDTLEKVIPSSFIIGALGWVTGMILDKPKSAHRLNYSSALLNDYLKNNPIEEHNDTAEAE